MTIRYKVPGHHQRWSNVYSSGIFSATALERLTHWGMKKNQEFCKRRFQIIIRYIIALRFSLKIVFRFPLTILPYWMVMYWYCKDNKALHEPISDHDDVIKWKNFPPYWLFARGIHRSPANSPHKGQRRGVLMLSLICAWISGWVNNH